MEPRRSRGDPAPACAKRSYFAEATKDEWRGACAVLGARPADSVSAGIAGALSTGHDSFAGVACVGAAGDGGGVQRNEHAATRRSAWGTGGLVALLSRNQCDGPGSSWRVQPLLSLPIRVARAIPYASSVTALLARLMALGSGERASAL